MKFSNYFISSITSLGVLIFTLLFGYFNYGAYSYGSIWGGLIGSIIAFIVLKKLNIYLTVSASIVGGLLMLLICSLIIKFFPISVRDVGDLIMPFINATLISISFILSMVTLTFISKWSSNFSSK
ncbi:hypothetical protein [Bacillus sp. OAE603]|uniref:hypothetical protein n=1 Tax=Gottfriedia sp. OAE603 TaxID=2663872 RepID=UPI001789A58F